MDKWIPHKKKFQNDQMISPKRESTTPVLRITNLEAFCVKASAVGYSLRAQGPGKYSLENPLRHSESYIEKDAKGYWLGFKIPKQLL